jgi:hypothetical protein
MHAVSRPHSPARRTAGALAICLLLAGWTPGPPSQPDSDYYGSSSWPDPTFMADRQCHGRFGTDDLNRFVPRARVALWLPGTRSVAVDPARRCITIKVESAGAARLAELVVRGVAVPRRAVFLQVDHG